VETSKDNDEEDLFENPIELVVVEECLTEGIVIDQPSTIKLNQINQTADRDEVETDADHPSG